MAIRWTIWYNKIEPKNMVDKGNIYSSTGKQILLPWFRLSTLNHYMKHNYQV